MTSRVVTWFRRQSVGRKLTTTAVATSGVTLLAACAVFVTYDYVTQRSRLVRDVIMLAPTSPAPSNTAALTFADAKAAADSLRAIGILDEHILTARLFTRDGACRGVRAPARTRATAWRLIPWDPGWPRSPCSSGIIYGGAAVTLDTGSSAASGEIGYGRDRTRISASGRSSPEHCSARS